MLLAVGCDTFSSHVDEDVDHEGASDTTEMDAEFPPGACVTLSIGNHSCATDEVPKIEALAIERDGVECLSATGADSHALFDGDCQLMGMIVTDELPCP